MDFQSLYPSVVDLTDIEYASSSFSSCCDLNTLVMDACNFNTDSAQNVVYRTVPMTMSPPPQKKRSGHLLRRRTSRERVDEPREPVPVSKRDSWGSESENIVAEGERIAKKLQSFDQAYVRTRQIACGSFSTVWETIHRASGLRYATKIISRHQLTQQEDDEAYKEVAIMARLHKSSGVCHLVEFFEDSSHFYLVMEYAQGGSLLSRIQDQGCYSKNEDQVKQLAKSLLESVQAMHAKGVVHCDLKPENILLKLNPSKKNRSKKQEFMVCDFGLAQRLGENDKSTEQCGTPAFVAPEVLECKPYDSQVDQWSLGVLLYFSMVGYLPFWDKTKRGLFRKVTKGDVRFDSKNWKHISANAKNFVANLLQVDPTTRMTADQALQHVWLSDELSLPISKPTSSTQGLLKQPRILPKRKNKSIGRRVWFALGRLEKQKQSIELPQEDDDADVLSTTSQTLSSVSSSDIHMVATATIDGKTKMMQRVSI